MWQQIPMKEAIKVCTEEGVAVLAVRASDTPDSFWLNDALVKGRKNMHALLDYSFLIWVPSSKEIIQAVHDTQIDLIEVRQRRRKR